MLGVIGIIVCNCKNRGKKKCLPSHRPGSSAPDITIAKIEEDICWEILVHVFCCCSLKAVVFISDNNRSETVEEISRFSRNGVGTAEVNRKRTSKHH
ncbi:hypothetical protein CDAR_472321 [Caerostris darwini]|uniref:Uncharacterized protein n=1 Tax=Caerostris darwini TaxID=1538125 RepID=A0AAV4VLX0_9ARAC|nr:hypothetical protein CDAR_472321 [Caerostris darwini]